VSASPVAASPAQVVARLAAPCAEPWLGAGIGIRREWRGVPLRAYQADSTCLATFWPLPSAWTDPIRARQGTRSIPGTPDFASPPWLVVSSPVPVGRLNPGPETDARISRD
jgi:hypothetical protein